MLEVLLRVWDPMGMEYFSESRRYFESMVDHDAYGYIHKPGYTDILQGVEVSTNSDGLRGPEIDIKCDREMTRVLVLGDSVVFGWGVSHENTFSQVLQTWISKDNSQTKVISAGVGSWNTRTEYEFLKSKGMIFSPDLIVLVVVSNDINPKRVGNTDVEKGLLFDNSCLTSRGKTTQEIGKLWRWSAEHSFAFGSIQYLWKVRNTREKSQKISEDCLQWQDAKSALDGIIDICAENGVVLVPFLYGSIDGVRTDSVLALYDRHLRAAGLTPGFMPGVLFSDPDLGNSIIDRHANAEGHRIIGQAVFDVVGPILRERVGDRARTREIGGPVAGGIS